MTGREDILGTYVNSILSGKSTALWVDTAKLDLPATFPNTVPLPFCVKAAVRFANRAQFHPIKYVLALAPEIPKSGSYLFEQTCVFEITDGELCEVVTEHGNIHAQDVIIASHFSFNNKALNPSRLSPHRFMY